MVGRIRTILVAFMVIAALGIAGPAGVAAATTYESGTWQGRVERHGAHFDYEGAPCPIEQEICPLILVRFRIVPTTEQAAKALPKVDGKAARLTGYLDRTQDDTHFGTLYVKKVTPVYAS